MSDVERLSDEIARLSGVQIVGVDDGDCTWTIPGDRFYGPDELAADLIAAGWEYNPPLDPKDWPELRAHLDGVMERLRDHEAHHRETIYGRLETALAERDHARDIAVSLEQELTQTQDELDQALADIP